ncbi:MAG: HD domain-containing phosphohydrolase [Campylobacterales bacterium]
MIDHKDYEREAFEVPKAKKELSSEETLELIFKYVALISKEKKLDSILILMADLGRELIVADRCTVWLIDESSNKLWTKVAHGMDAIEIPIGAGVVGSAISTKEPLIINDAYSDDRFNKDVDKKTGYKTNNIIAIPFKNSEGKIIGAYQAINKMTDAAIFSEDDLNRLDLAATYAGNSLESAMLYQEIENTQKEIIYTMAEVGESRSKETGNHVKRVAEYSRVIAKGYGLPPSEVELLKMASPMHDIGKVAIPDAILLKPGKLTDEEFAYMQRHTSLGYDMLKHSSRKILKAASVVAYEHHEKWNGRGYPRGIKGEDIHIFGRITALADVFDALSSDRCYKKAWELDRVLNLFKEERGEHFEPKIVDVFFERLEDVLEIKELYKDNFE